MSLENYGWSPFFSVPFGQYQDRGLSPGRVSTALRGLWVIQTGSSELKARVRSRNPRNEDGSSSLPAVGDWVAWQADDTETATIFAVLPRKSTLCRKVPGARTQRQVVAANVDTVFLVMGLDRDFNLRRMERLLTMVYESGASPVIVLNKADVSECAESQRLETEGLAPGTEVLVCSAREGVGMEGLKSFMNEGQTIALVGSSGAGKSTIINCLFGEEMLRTCEVRAKDGRGRHTTTHRQLFKHPAGGLLIDNPGIREVQLWASEEALAATFEDIESLARSCRFRDCSHSTEPGCAVLRAVRSGLLAEARLNHFQALARELRYLAVKQDKFAQLAQRREWRVLHKRWRNYEKGEG